MKGFERLPDLAGFQVWRSKTPVEDKIEVHFVAGIDPYDKGQFSTTAAVATPIGSMKIFENKLLPKDTMFVGAEVYAMLSGEIDFKKKKQEFNEAIQQMSKYFAEVKLTKEKNETESKRFKSTD